MSKEEERALWDAAVALLDSNASPASVEVMKPPVQGEIMPEERQQEIEAA